MAGAAERKQRCRDERGLVDRRLSRSLSHRARQRAERRACRRGSLTAMRAVSCSASTRVTRQSGCAAGYRFPSDHGRLISAFGRTIGTRAGTVVADVSVLVVVTVRVVAGTVVATVAVRVVVTVTVLVVGTVLVMVVVVPFIVVVPVVVT